MPAETMVARMAQAIRSAWEAHGEVPFPLYDREAEELARAALLEIRNPTDAMILSMAEFAWEEPIETFEELCSVMRTVWFSTIQEALAEHKEGGE